MDGYFAHKANSKFSWYTLFTEHLLEHLELTREAKISGKKNNSRLTPSNLWLFIPLNLKAVITKWTQKIHLSCHIIVQPELLRKVSVGINTEISLLVGNCLPFKTQNMHNLIWYKFCLILRTNYYIQQRGKESWFYINFKVLFWHFFLILKQRVIHFIVYLIDMHIIYINSTTEVWSTWSPILCA